MHKEVVINKENAEYQLIQTIKENRKKRNRYKKVFVSGVKNINTIIKNNINIENVYIVNKGKLSNWAKNVISIATNKAYINESLVQKIIQKEELPELFILVEMPKYDFSHIDITNNLIFLIIDRSSNRGNLGSIIRSANALKVNGILLYGHGVDSYDQEVILSSIGTVFSLPIIKDKSLDSIKNWINKLKDKLPNLQIISSSAKAEKAIYQINFNKPTILIVGNETYGVSRDMNELSNELTKIPIYGDASSLNVACATTTYLYEISRQRELNGI